MVNLLRNVVEAFIINQKNGSSSFIGEHFLGIYFVG